MALNEELKEDLKNIKDDAKAFIDHNVDYYQLLGLKIGSKAFSLILKIFLLALFLSIALLFISFAAAFALGILLNSNTLGFLSMTRTIDNKYLILLVTFAPDSEIIVS